VTKTTLLVTVKAYPVVDAESMQKAVCVAGISEEQPRRWIRLFPLDFRGLGAAQKFKKYQLITLDLQKPRRDSRPESRIPIIDTIELGDTIGADAGTWRQRLDFVEPIMDESMCAIQRAQDETGQSLGAFEPMDVSDLRLSEGKPWSPGQDGILDQESLLGGTKRPKLEPPPIRAKYIYRCADPKCGGHEQHLIDWELGQLYRNLRDKGEGEEARHAKVRAKFLDELAGPEKRTIFLTGNMAKYPKSFLVLGLLWPKRTPQEELF
jgi:hypothetical protein